MMTFLSTNKTTTIVSTMMLLLLSTAAVTASRCNLCGPNSSVPRRNADKLVTTTMGNYNCKGLYDAALQGVIPSGQCNSMRNQFAPVCCVANRKLADDEEEVEEQDHEDTQAEQQDIDDMPELEEQDNKATDQQRGLSGGAPPVCCC